jgi:hypothetical protein
MASNLKVLSILQPWAWLIVVGHKPVENRRWVSSYRGPLLIHAGKKWGREQRDDLALVRRMFPRLEIPDHFDLGGIVGRATMTDCVSSMDSPWFFGPNGFVMRDPRILPFFPCRGALSFFAAPDDYPYLDQAA